MLQKLVVLVEEPSMEAALELLLPQLLGGVDFDIHPFQGKHNLLQKLPERLKGYASWLPDNWWILVLVDETCFPWLSLLAAKHPEDNPAP